MIFFVLYFVPKLQKGTFENSLKLEEIDICANGMKKNSRSGKETC